MKGGGQPDVDSPSMRRRWAYAAGLTDERPTSQDVRGRRPNRAIYQRSRLDVADMKFATLVNFYYDAGHARNWVFPIDPEALGLMRRWGGLTKLEREERGL